MRGTPTRSRPGDPETAQRRTERQDSAKRRACPNPIQRKPNGKRHKDKPLAALEARAEARAEPAARPTRTQPTAPQERQVRPRAEASRPAAAHTARRCVPERRPARSRPHAAHTAHRCVPERRPHRPSHATRAASPLADIASTRSPAKSQDAQQQHTCSRSNTHATPPPRMHASSSAPHSRAHGLQQTTCSGSNVHTTTETLECQRHTHTVQSGAIHAAIHARACCRVAPALLPCSPGDASDEAGSRGGHHRRTLEEGAAHPRGGSKGWRDSNVHARECEQMV